MKRLIVLLGFCSLIAAAPVSAQISLHIANQTACDFDVRFAVDYNGGCTTWEQPSCTVNANSHLTCYANGGGASSRIIAIQIRPAGGGAWITPGVSYWGCFSLNASEVYSLLCAGNNVTLTAVDAVNADISD
jgi:hypothetical protein